MILVHSLLVLNKNKYWINNLACQGSFIYFLIADVINAYLKLCAPTGLWPYRLEI